MSPGIASEIALCNIKLSPAWHHTVSAAPIIRGEGQIGLMPTSIAPRRDMLSATCGLEALPKACSKDSSGRRHGDCTLNPTFPGIENSFLNCTAHFYARSESEAAAAPAPVVTGQPNSESTPSRCHKSV